MRPKGVPFGYLEFSRAKRRELCTYLRTCAHARRRWRRRPAGRRRARARARGPWPVAWVPYLVLFESGSVGPRKDSNLQRVSVRANRSDRSPTAVGKPTVRLIGCDDSVRTVATAGIWRTRIPLQSAIKSAPGVHSQTHQNLKNLSLF